MNRITSLLAAAWAVAALIPSSAGAQMSAASKPLITRIKMATIGAPDVAKVEAWYSQHLDFKVRERGTVSVAMAESWGAPKSAGRPFVLLSSDGSPDVFIRAVQIDAPAGYKPMTTLGWNAFEIIIDDLDKVHAKMKASPFPIIGEPHSLGGPFASIHAMQVLGPANEVLYLTTETGDRAKSTLPVPKALVDRTFIFILAGHDVDALNKFYGDVFKMQVRDRFDGALPLAAKAQGLPETHIFGFGLVRGAERGNNIELDGYPPQAPARPRAEGQLPPGNSMASFNVDNLDAIKVNFIKPPAKLYGPKRAASFIGPAGELVELIEEPRP